MKRWQRRFLSRASRLMRDAAEWMADRANAIERKAERRRVKPLAFPTEFELAMDRLTAMVVKGLAERISADIMCGPNGLSALIGPATYVTTPMEYGGKAPRNHLSPRVIQFETYKDAK